MANTVLTGGFPAGTSVSAYKLSDVEQLIEGPVNSPPRPGTAEETQTTAAGSTTTFTTLTTGTAYAAYASVDGRHVWVEFSGT